MSPGVLRGPLNTPRNIRMHINTRNPPSLITADRKTELNDRPLGNERTKLSSLNRNCRSSLNYSIFTNLLKAQLHSTKHYSILSFNWQPRVRRQKRTSGRRRADASVHRRPRVLCAVQAAAATKAPHAAFQCTAADT